MIERHLLPVITLGGVALGMFGAFLLGHESFAEETTTALQEPLNEAIARGVKKREGPSKKLGRVSPPSGLGFVEASAWIVSRNSETPFLRSSYQIRLWTQRRASKVTEGLSGIRKPHSWLLIERPDRATTWRPWSERRAVPVARTNVEERELSILPISSHREGTRLDIHLNGLLVGEDRSPRSLIRGGRFRWPREPFRGWALFPGYMPAPVHLDAQTHSLQVVLKKVAWALGRVKGMEHIDREAMLLFSFPGSAHEPEKVMLGQSGSFKVGPVPAGFLNCALLGVPAYLKRHSQTIELRPGWQTLDPLELQPSVALEVIAPGLSKSQRVWLSGWYDSYPGHRDASRSPTWPSIEGEVRETGKIRFPSVNLGKIAGWIWTEGGDYLPFGPLNFEGHGSLARLVLTPQRPGSISVRVGRGLSPAHRIVFADAWYLGHADQVSVRSEGRKSLRIRHLALGESGPFVAKGLWPVQYSWSLLSGEGMAIARGFTEVRSGQTTILDLSSINRGGSILLVGAAESAVSFTLLSHQEGLVARGTVPRAGEKVMDGVPAGEYVLRIQQGSERRRIPLTIAKGRRSKVLVWR